MSKAERIGNRKRRDSFSKRIPDLGYYFIVTDTQETEKNYLMGLRDTLPPELSGRLVIKISNTKTENLVLFCKEQAAMASQYAQPWIVFDRDRVVSFDTIIDDAKRSGINVGWSNPCIEVWLSAYFGKILSCSDSVTCCQRFATIYEKETGQEYQKSDKQLYPFLLRYGEEQNAIKRAEQRLQQYQRDGIHVPSKMCPCTTLHQLVAEIREKSEKGQR